MSRGFTRLPDDFLDRQLLLQRERMHHENPFAPVTMGVRGATALFREALGDTQLYHKPSRELTLWHPTARYGRHAPLREDEDFDETADPAEEPIELSDCEELYQPGDIIVRPGSEVHDLIAEWNASAWDAAPVPVTKLRIKHDKAP